MSARHYYSMPRGVRKRLAQRGIDPDASTEKFLTAIRDGSANLGRPMPERAQNLLNALMCGPREHEPGIGSPWGDEEIAA